MRENEKHLLRKGLLISCCSCCSCCFNQIFWGARSALWICCCSWAFLQCAFAYNFHLLILMRGRKGRLSWSCCCFNQNLVRGHFTCNWHFLILMGGMKIIHWEKVGSLDPVTKIGSSDSLIASSLARHVLARPTDQLGTFHKCLDNCQRLNRQKFNTYFGRIYQLLTFSSVNKVLE